MKSNVRTRSVSVALAIAVILALVVPGAAGAQDATPIPPGPPTTLPDYIGTPAKAHPTANNGVPQNPFLAPNAFAHAHKDIWMSDSGNVAGPLGRNPIVLSTTLPDTHPNSWLTPCGSYGFDSHGRLIVSCWGADEASIVMLDPDTLEVLTYYPLENVESGLVGEGAQKFPKAFYHVNDVNAYYFVALDFRTGEAVWEKLVGTGDRFDNWWLPVAIGPNGALYGMVYAGVTMMRDTP